MTRRAMVLLALGCGDRWEPGPPPHAVGFLLRCAHEATPCEGCHPLGVTLGPLPTDCGPCHARPASHDPEATQVCAGCHPDSGCSWASD